MSEHKVLFKDGGEDEENIIECISGADLSTSNQHTRISMHFCSSYIACLLMTLLPFNTKSIRGINPFKNATEGE